MANVVELLAVKEVAKDKYESLLPPDRMGNAAAIAYGGCTVGVAANVACLSVPKGFHPYTMMGSFLGPAFIDRKLQASVRRIRDTRTFVTREVEVSQIQDDGSSRVCLIMLADFQIQEPASVMQFSAPPTRDWGPPEAGIIMEQAREELLESKKISRPFYEASKQGFKLGLRIYDLKFCRKSIMTETLFGIAKHIQTSQEHLSLTEKVSADWVRSKVPLDGENEHVAALICCMDMAMSFIALSHSHKFLDDVGACSSLDFSFRLFTNKLNFNEYHLREMTAIAASEGRAFHEARLWDSQKNMVAIMTQQGIMRPKPVKQKI